jgi:hypothetical protein
MPRRVPSLPCGCVGGTRWMHWGVIGGRDGEEQGRTGGTALGPFPTADRRVAVAVDPASHQRSSGSPGVAIRLGFPVRHRPDGMGPSPTVPTHVNSSGEYVHPCTSL